ncbi:MAG: zinc-ribbon domain-containing protein [Chloroflexaceae bacterium]|nr:zinc-ribbon domain-containing protein [Chloroflexaceae bacterium]
MAYQCNLGTGQVLFVENRGDQTLVTLVSASGGQQQSQRNSLTTGPWTAPPSVFRTTQGMFLLRVETHQAQHYIQVQSGGMQALQSAPSLVQADSLPLQQVAQQAGTESPAMAPMQPMEPMQPMQPMKPMEPMKPMDPMQMQMGDMQMQMNPMRMKMGDMQLEAQPAQPAAAKPAAIRSAKRFCTQCGQEVAAEDRFCGNCGHQVQKA